MRTFEEFLNLAEAPYQIYGPDPHGPSDGPVIPIGKPYQNKKRAKNRADKLDADIGGYRHFVRKVDEDFVPLTSEKEKRVANRVGELHRDIQLLGARAKSLKSGPFARFRSQRHKDEIEKLGHSARKKEELVRKASYALSNASVDRSANIQAKINHLKQRLKDLESN